MGGYRSVRQGRLLRKEETKSFIEGSRNFKIREREKVNEGRVTGLVGCRVVKRGG